jgi:ribosome-associated translation inhibitor RaiA
MRLDLQGSAVARTPAVRRHVEQRALFELARYGDDVDCVKMRVTERPPSAEHRFHCGVAVVVMHDGLAGHVLARAEGDDVLRLVERVLARASSQVGGEIERAHAAQQARAEWLALAAGERRGS